MNKPIMEESQLLNEYICLFRKHRQGLSLFSFTNEILFMSTLKKIFYLKFEKINISMNEMRLWYIYLFQNLNEDIF
jgi:hypothetical protein